MEKIEILEQKISTATKIIHQLREKNIKAAEQYKKLAQENELLDSENKQVRKWMAELENLKEERNAVRQKCLRLIQQFEKMGL